VRKDPLLIYLVHRASMRPKSLIMGLQLPCPAVQELMDCLQNNVPFLAEQYHDGSGKYLPRLQWRKDGTLNRHDAGLALDMILYSTDFNENALALDLCYAFKKNQPLMKWRGMIYLHTYTDGLTLADSNWSADDHLYHVHIDWFDYSLYAGTGKTSIPWPPEAMTAGFSTNLGPDLATVYSAWSSGADPNL
jgi:hypothetical protein